MDFYNTAGRAIDLLDSKKGSLKSIVFSLAAGIDPSTKPKSHYRRPAADTSPAPRRISDGKRLLKVVAESLRYRQVIEAIFENVDVLSLEPKVFGSAKSPIQASHLSRTKRLPRPQSLLLVLVHDHLFSARGVSLAKIHKIRLAIERHSSALKSELSRLMVRNRVAEVAELVDKLSPNPTIPSRSASLDGLAPASPSKLRWIRVNAIKWSVAEAIAWFKGAGWTQVGLGTLIRSSNAERMFAEDDHVACLLALPSTVVLAQLPPYLDGRLIAQDKASCMPAQLLLGDYPPSRPLEVIDATSAPGNKTTMLSAIVGSRGKVWAFERDQQRFKVLQQMVKRAGCTNVKCIHGDFLAIKPTDARFQNVTHIMVDPSCSGSGISNRLDHLSHADRGTRDENRVQSLSRFQTTIVSHALRFRSVHQVVYSTCSIWKEENEEVVLKILKKPEMMGEGWGLKAVNEAFVASEKRAWKRAGQEISAEARHLTDRMVRFDPTVDQTIGFFAAVFQRPWPGPEAHGGGPDRAPETRVCSPSGPAADHRPANRRLWRGIRPGRLVSLSPSA